MGQSRREFIKSTTAALSVAGFAAHSTTGRSATDGGNTSLWSHFFLPSTAQNSYMSILELGMLGTGIPCRFFSDGGRLTFREPDDVRVVAGGEGADLTAEPDADEEREFKKRKLVLKDRMYRLMADYLRTR